MHDSSPGGSARSTRRALLAAGAGALAGGMLGPHALLAAALAEPAAPVLSERSLGKLGRRGVALALAHSADLVGVQWVGPRDARVQLRFRTPGGRWSRWASAGAHGHAAEGEPLSSAVIGDPVWAGGTRELALRSSTPIGPVRVHLVDVSGGRGARAQAALARPLSAAAALAAPVLDAGAGQPPIIARSAWAGSSAPPRVAPAYGAVHMAFVHHTENPNGYSPREVPAMLLAIYAFHRYIRGWNDIGYNFVVDLFGRVFEARAGGIDEAVVGAHAGGFNLASTGVAVLGSFMEAPISHSARATLQRLLAWKLSLHGVPALGSVRVRVNPAGASYSRFPAGAHVPLPRIAGHRDGDSTDCPGDALYGELAGVRSAVRGLAPRPTLVTLTLAPAAAAPPAPAPGAPPPTAGSAPAAAPAPAGQAGPATLAGAVSFLDGTPIPGARVLLQARSVARRGERVRERALAQLSADAQGRFSLPAQFAGVTTREAPLRAMTPGGAGYGAGVSRTLRVPLSLAPSAAPGPSPADQPPSPTTASAPPAPAPTQTGAAPPAP